MLYIIVDELLVVDDVLVVDGVVLVIDDDVLVVVAGRNHLVLPNMSNQKRLMIDHTLLAVVLCY